MVRLPARLRPLFPYLKPAFVGVTRLVAPGAQRLSRARGGLLPTSIALTLEEAAEGSGGRCVTARPAEVISRPPMLGRPAGLPLLDTSDGESFARVAVAELPDARVLGPHRAVISGSGALVNDVSWYFGTKRPREHPLFLNPFPEEPLHVEGRLGVLASRGDSNYYHFLVDVLPRIGVLAQAPQIAQPERWYVPVQTAFQRDLLDLFGIGRSKRIDAAENQHVRADFLIVPGQPAMTEKNPPWVVEFLRSRLLGGVVSSGPRRRLYVTRGPSANNRTVVNEQQVLALLTERGFEAIDPGTMPVAEQIRAFASASVIVSAHGAALANLVFASPGSSVLELFPAGCRLPDFWRRACGVPGLRYRYLSAGGGPHGGWRQTRGTAIVRDIEVDLAELASMLDELADGS